MKLLHDNNVLKNIKKAKNNQTYINELFNVLEDFKNGNTKVRMSCNREGIEKKIAEAINQIIHNYSILQKSNKELEQFAFVASHDLQEPLRMVSSYTQLLERRYAEKLDQDGLDYIHFAVDGSKRMQNLVSDLLDYSRISNEKKPFEVADTNVILKVTLNVLNKLIVENNATITFDELPVIKCHPNQVQRLFQNLIINAIRYRRKEVAPKIHISCEKTKGINVFSVCDNGIGIAPENYRKIFQIFKRIGTKDDCPGTGIGLSVCKRIVESHKGKIWIKSTIDKGTTFYFTLGK
jgi:light-regulated signal transduction histidine kinase (bacteriophytochrome)